MTARFARGIDGKCLPWAGDGDQARARPQRSARGKPRGPGREGCARDDHNGMPPAIFVSRRVRHRKMFKPEGGELAHVRGLIAVENVCG